MIGRVVSTKSQKTATVLVERIAVHPLYRKTYVQSKKYLVDDSIGVKIGDIVDFINCKPVSKRKRWKIIKVVGQDFVEVAKIQLKKEAEETIAEVMPEEKSGNSENSEVQKVGGSESQNSDISGKSDSSDTQSSSESSEKNKVKARKRGRP